MNTEDEVQLGAYVDGELSIEQQARMLEALRDDQELQRQVRETKQLKNRLQLAYANPPGMPLRPTARASREGWSRWAGAALLVCSGVLLGWLAHPLTSIEPQARLERAGPAPAPTSATLLETRIAFHLTSPEQTVAKDLLDEVESLLLSFEHQGRPLRVEIISHGAGLGLLRERLSAHRDRIASMDRRFDNLTFVACRNTMERLWTEQGIQVRLVPGAQVTSSGITRVVRRQWEGWAYVKV